MDKRIEDKKDTNGKLITFYKSNKNKIIISLTLILILLVAFFFLENRSKKKNKILAEKYITAGLYLSSENKKKAKTIYEDLILSENKFYSILALNTILEKKLESDHQKIVGYFKILEDFKKNENYDLIILKKALYLMKNSEEEKGLSLLKKLNQSDTKFKKLTEEILKK